MPLFDIITSVLQTIGSNSAAPSSDNAGSSGDVKINGSQKSSSPLRRSRSPVKKQKLSPFSKHTSPTHHVAAAIKGEAKKLIHSSHLHTQKAVHLSNQAGKHLVLAHAIKHGGAAAASHVLALTDGSVSSSDGSAPSSAPSSASTSSTDPQSFNMSGAGSTAACSAAGGSYNWYNKQCMQGDDASFWNSCLTSCKGQTGSQFQSCISNCWDNN